MRLFVVGLIYILCILIAYSIGKKRDSVLDNLLLVVLFGPLGLLFVLIHDGRKDCPACKSKVHAGTLLCPQCHSALVWNKAKPWWVLWGSANPTLR